MGFRTVSDLLTVNEEMYDSLGDGELLGLYVFFNGHNGDYAQKKSAVVHALRAMPLEHRERLGRHLTNRRERLEAQEMFERAGVISEVEERFKAEILS